MIRAKAGVTLLEALVVVGITALTLSMMYTVGVRGVFHAFGLGDRAVETADAEIAKLAHRDVVDSILVPPVAVSSQLAEAELDDQLDDTFVGSPTEFSGRLVGARETPCAPAGTDARIIVRLETDATATRVLCALDGVEGEAELARFRFGDAAFSYSEDGTTWADEWLVERGAPVEAQVLPNGELRRVMIRLASNDGRLQMLALATSGRPVAQQPPQNAAGGGGRGGGGGGRGGGGGGGGRGGGRGGGGGGRG